MKILQVNVYYYRFGGSESVMFNTTDLLRANGHEVIHFSLKWENNLDSPQSQYFPESKETRKGVLAPIKNVITYFYHREAAKKLDQLLKKEKPDLAQIHLFWGQITPSVLPVLKKYNIPVLFTIHEYRMVCPNYTFRNGKGEVCEQCEGKKYWKCIKNKCCKNSYGLSAMMAAEMYFRNTFMPPSKYIDGLIYVSNFAKLMHEKYMPQLSDKSNIVLYNPSDYIYDEVNSPRCPLYYLYFGRLSYEKGIDTLINAMIKRPNCYLKLVGTGAEENSLKNKVKEGGYTNIEFLGFKKGDELKDLVRNAYFIIVPSEWYENNPMTIIEGYSASTPVIGARIGGIPEITIDGVTGFQFDSGSEASLLNAIDKAEILSNEDYMTMRRNTLKFARNHFAKDNYYNQLIKFYKLFVR